LVVWGGRGVGEGGDRNPPSLSPRGSGGGVTPRQGAWGQSPQKTESYPELRLQFLIYLTDRKPYGGKIRMKLEQILKVAVRGGASDIILKVSSLPRFRHNGGLVSLSDGAEITEEIMAGWIKELVPGHLLQRLKERGDVDFGYNAPFQARFRVNVFRQRGRFGMVFRVISSFIKSLEELQLPKVIEQGAHKKRGLILVTGATGSGKSTTLAAIVQKINTQKAAHIITIEDPIEFYYKDEMSTINQREIGEDASSFSQALQASLRQNPDIILVGELRDEETTQTALMAAETGHLVLSTLHTQDAVDSLTRLMSYFSPHQHRSIRIQLANTLQMIVSQRLVSRLDGRGRVAACEILIANSLVRDVILKGEHFDPIHDAIRKGQKNYGMQSFDQSLIGLYHNKVISQEEAMKQASSPDDMALLMSGVGGEED
jgi:twitching motility protein PilT